MGTHRTLRHHRLRTAIRKLRRRPTPPVAEAASNALSSRAELAGLFAAAVSIPRSYQQSLMPRSPFDQGLVSGLALSVTYTLTSTMAEAIDAAAERSPWRIESNETVSRATIATDLAALGVSLAAQQVLRRRDDEHLGRAAMRTLSYRLGASALSGIAATAAHSASLHIDRASNRWVPPAVTAAVSGLAVATATDLARRDADADREDRLTHPRDWLGAAGTGAAVTGAVAGLAATERAFASTVHRGLERLGGPLKLPWALIGHAASLLGVALVTERAVSAVNLRAELAASEAPADAAVPPTKSEVSAGPGSAIGWRSLTAQARRHVTGTVTTAQITSVMGATPATAPIRVYVGVDNGATSNRRVELAMAEIDRTGALDRSLLVLVSPTGTGQINPALIESVEYFTLGDCASVALQYSKRPSVLSMDRLAQAREQNWMLWVALQQRLFARPPERRPKVVLYGESLGAHTSQDVFLHWGTHGPKVMGIDHALWVGTPFASKWKQQVFGDPRPDVDPAAVGEFPTVADLAALDPTQRRQLQYVLLTHDDDAVSYFGLDLLVRSPDWLEDPRPAGVPATMRWTPVITFLQVLADMKNATNIVPGRFEARGHDYRKGLAQAVNLTFRLGADNDQVVRVEAALRQSEQDRAHRRRPATPPSDLPGATTSTAPTGADTAATTG